MTDPQSLGPLELKDIAKEMRETISDADDFGTVWQFLTDYMVECMDANLVHECVVAEFVDILDAHRKGTEVGT